MLRAVSPGGESGFEPRLGYAIANARNVRRELVVDNRAESRERERGAERECELARGKPALNQRGLRDGDRLAAQPKEEATEEHCSGSGRDAHRG